MGGVTFLFSVGFFFVSQPPLPTPFQIPPPPPKKKEKNQSSVDDLIQLKVGRL
jgi:hypothetical protein